MNQYQYDAYDQQIVEERARQFAGQVQRRISGETTENEFKPVRLQNGLYMQLHAYMFRIAVPYGVLNSRQLRKLAHLARTYDRGYGHLTTRQNVQFNWPKLEDIPKALEQLAEVQMHAVQTSGNCIRNVTSDPFAGVAPDELEDPRPYCEILRQWSTFHPEFAFLPRKFKIAITGTPDTVRPPSVASRSGRAAAWAARRSSASRSANLSSTSTCSATAKRSCACTTCMGGATTSSRRASRSW
jgi:sulfite reductase (NADPH) hemoprotein beta-component